MGIRISQVRVAGRIAVNRVTLVGGDVLFARMAHSHRVVQFKVVHVFRAVGQVHRRAVGEKSAHCAVCGEGVRLTA